MPHGAALRVLLRPRTEAAPPARAQPATGHASAALRAAKEALRRDLFHAIAELRRAGAPPLATWELACPCAAPELCSTVAVANAQSPPHAVRPANPRPRVC